MIEHYGQKQGCSAKKTDISLMPLDSNDKYTGIMLRYFELGMHSRFHALQYQPIALQGVPQVKAKTRYRKFLLCLPPLLFLSVQCPLTHADVNSYIDAVRADAEEFSTGSFTPPENSPWVAKIPDQSATGDTPQSKLEDFSNFLKDKSPGSYIFYSKLPKDYQTRLHQEYLATGDLQKVKQDIFKYSREVKRQNR
ncbi:MAG: hypothetical protein P8171_02655 [Candidatus Thiodiazotropha sp.]